MFASIFNYAPTARDLFKSVNSQDMQSPEFKAHVTRVIGGLDRVISMLDNKATLDSDLAHLKSQHDSRNIDPANFVVSNRPPTLGWFFAEERYRYKPSCMVLQ